MSGCRGAFVQTAASPGQFPLHISSLFDLGGPSAFSCQGQGGFLMSGHSSLRSQRVPGSS